MPFANSQVGGNNFCFPDTCNTPAPSGVVPITYPNTSQPMTGVPAAYHILVGGGPAHNMATTAPMSNGDNAGVAMGMASGMVMGPTRHQLGSTALLVQGMPATRLLMDITGHNGMTPNGVGATIAPCQTKLLVLR